MCCLPQVHMKRGFMDGARRHCHRQVVYVGRSHCSRLLGPAPPTLVLVTSLNHRFLLVYLSHFLSFSCRVLHEFVIHFDEMLFIYLKLQWLLLNNLRVVCIPYIINYRILQQNTAGLSLGYIRWFMFFCMCLVFIFVLDILQNLMLVNI